MDQEIPDPIPTSKIGPPPGTEFRPNPAQNTPAECRGLQESPGHPDQQGNIGYPLHSGRTLRVSAGTDPQTDQMEILSADGRVEVEILLTANGPMVRVHGGSLKMTSTQSIQLESAGPVDIRAEELRVRTTRSVHLDGETIRLNCQDLPVTQRPGPQPPTLCDKHRCTDHHQHNNTDSNQQ